MEKKIESKKKARIAKEKMEADKKESEQQKLAEKKKEERLKRSEEKQDLILAMLMKIKP